VLTGGSESVRVNFVVTEIAVAAVDQLAELVDDIEETAAGIGEIDRAITQQVDSTRR